MELRVVDDACEAHAAYEAAKAFLADSPVAGVIGGVCEEAAAREVPVIDSTGIPFLVTAATADDLVSEDSASTYMLNGTVYQQALSTVYWMNYSGADRLAVLQDETPESKELARQAIGLRRPGAEARRACRPSSPAARTWRRSRRPRVRVEAELRAVDGRAGARRRAVKALREASRTRSASCASRPITKLLYDNRVILEVEKGAFNWERSLRTDSLD